MHFCAGSNIEQAKDHLSRGKLLDAAFCLGGADELLTYLVNNPDDELSDITKKQKSEVEELKIKIWQA